jgi:hypothetical protein
MQLVNTVREAALCSVSAPALLIPPTQHFLEAGYVDRPEFLGGVGERASRVLAAAVRRLLAHLSPAQVGGALHLLDAVRERASVAILANAL